MTKKCEAKVDPVREKKRKADLERLAGKMRRLAELETWAIFGKKKIAELTERASIGDAIRQEAMEVGRLRLEVQAEVAARDFWCEIADARKNKIKRLERLLIGVSVLAGLAIGVAWWLA